MNRGFRWMGLLAAVLCLPALAHELVRVSPQLQVGGQPDATQLEHAAKQGVSTVIDLRMPDEARGFDEAATAKHLGLRYLRLPIDGANGINEDNAATLRQLLAQSQGSVLLHCASGNRAGALLGLMRHDEGLDEAASLALAREAGMRSLEPVLKARLDAASPAAAN